MANQVAEMVVRSASTGTANVYGLPNGTWHSSIADGIVRRNAPLISYLVRAPQSVSNVAFRSRKIRVAFSPKRVSDRPENVKSNQILVSLTVPVDRATGRQGRGARPAHAGAEGYERPATQDAAGLGRAVDRPDAAASRHADSLEICSTDFGGSCSGERGAVGGPLPRRAAKQ